MEDDSLGTCSVGLLQQTRLIRADKGQIRRLEIEKVVCVWPVRGKRKRLVVVERGKNSATETSEIKM